MARILVVDDSLFVRTTMARILTGAGHELLAPVSSGEAAVDAATAQRPDLILMDLALPGIDGLRATRTIMDRAPTRILVFSAAGGDRRRETLRTLEAGAIDFLPKPAAADFGRQAAELLGRIEAALVARPRPGPGATHAPVLAPPPVPAGGFLAIAVGVSTGGPSALRELLAALPRGGSPPILVAQHLLPGWTQCLAEQLAESTGLDVVEARPREPARPGTVYLAPGDLDLEITADRKLRLTRDRTAVWHPSADVLFRSLARTCGSRGLALVMTGMGTDGTEGARQVRAGGGVVLAQDEASSVVWGMPGSVVKAGLAHGVAPPAGLGRYLAQLVGT